MYDYGFDVKEVNEKIDDFIKDFFKDKKGPAIIGLSGGKDSTFCAKKLVDNLGPDRVIGIMMPNGIQKDISDSEKVCEILGIKKVVANIEGVYSMLNSTILHSILDSFGKSFDLNDLYSTNQPARCRMLILYGFAALFGGYVCNTCNLSEDVIGYSTKYGDCCGDFSLINMLTVTEVRALGDYVGLPKELIHKAPSDGMCGKTDEDNLGFTYELLDTWIRTGLPPKSKEVYEKIKRMYINPNTLYKLLPMARIENFNLPFNMKFIDLEVK